jgi:hypothetical protein
MQNSDLLCRHVWQRELGCHAQARQFKLVTYVTPCIASSAAIGIKLESMSL